MTKLKNNIKNLSLAFSLSLNLVFAGIFFGFVLAGKPPRPFPPHLNWVSDSLNEEDRRELRPLIRQHAKRNRHLRHEMRSSQKALETAILIEPFNEQAVTSALESLQENSNNLQTNMHEQMISIMKTLSPDQRKTALNSLKNRLGPRHRNRGKPLVEE